MTLHTWATGRSVAGALGRGEAAAGGRGRQASELDLILAPSLYDAHQDHRLLAELPTGWRRHLALGYEIPSPTGTSVGRIYMSRCRGDRQNKVELLTKAYRGRRAELVGRENFLGLARLRGMSAGRYAERFMTNKVTLTW